MIRQLICCISLCGLFATVLPAQDTPDYERDIAPIFRKYCQGCHNDDDREGDFTLESFDGLQETPNGPAFLPGQASSSRLIRLLKGLDDPQMPPEGEPTPSDQDLGILEAWIDAGAKGPTGQEPNRLRVIVPTIPNKSNRIPITALDWAGDGSSRAVGRFGEVLIQRRSTTTDPLTGKKLKNWVDVNSLSGFPGKVTSVHFCKGDGHLITASGVTGLGGVAILWEWPLKRRVREFQGHRDIMLDAEVSPNGKLLATCSYDSEIILWDVDNGTPLRTLSGHNGAVFDVAFSPDGTALASASADGTCKVWSVSDGVRLDTMGQPLAEQYAVTFSPDGKFITGGGADNRIRVWRFRSRNRPRINPLVHARFAHEGPIVSLMYAKGGAQLISLSEDQTVKIWETRSYTELKLIEDPVDVAVALAVDPEGNEFFLGRLDGSLESFSTPGIRTSSHPNCCRFAGLGCHHRGSGDDRRF